MKEQLIMDRSSTLKRLLAAFLALVLSILLITNSVTAQPDREVALKTMRRAAKFMVEEVSYNGGYVWTYSADLSDQWGEAPARKSQIWVQNGTLDMAHTYLDCWEATGDDYFLECAKKAVNALVYGQHPLGGWHYFIDFDKPGLDQWYRDVFSNFKWGMEEYRHYYGNCTFDDDVTTGATRLLMRMYLATLDPAYKEPLDRALDFIRLAQYPTGGWPQRYPLRYEFVHDGLADYTSYYTNNDGAMSEIIGLLVEAYELFGDERNLEAAIRGMDFLIVLQGPAKQAAWADQYGMDLKPAWGRTHEHAGYMPRYTLQSIQALQDAYLFTGDPRYLKPIPAALDWLEKSAFETMKDGRIVLADRYEYGTNRPIMKTYSDEVNDEGYGIWKWAYGHEGRVSRVNILSLRKEYDQIAALSPEQARNHQNAKRKPLSYSPGKVDPKKVETLINTLDKRGAWVTELNVFAMDVTKPSPPGVKWDNYRPADDDDHARDRIQGISTSQFRRNMRVLADYMEQAK